MSELDQRGPLVRHNEKLRVIQRMKLQCINREKNHRKFYRVDVCYDSRYNKYVVDATWGRIGREGQHMVKAEGKLLDDVLEEMEKVLLQKLFKKGYEMIDIQRWPVEAREEDRDRFIDEDWD